jgi:metallo-beta-lactamase family protein
VIRVHLCGAAGEVTGSGYLVESPQSRVLVDFGVFQGGRDARLRSRELGPVEPERLNAMVLTHAHIDHSGRVPLLYSNGYRGSVFATHATLALTPILLEDLSRLDIEWVSKLNRKRERAGKPPLEPIYVPEAVRRMHQHARPLNYRHAAEVAAGVALRLHDAGHIMGSASARLEVEDGDRRQVLVFSGDLGPKNVPILRDPDPPRGADVVFLESTYGGRRRQPLAETVEAFKQVVGEAAARGERVLIPSFAVGRAQLILYYLAEAVREGRLPPDFPIVLDSPMATEATEALLRHPEVLDPETTELIEARQFAKDLSGLVVIRSARESQALNNGEPCIILSASGMCEGGRIVHHLRHNLWRPGVQVVLVGYMAEGTLGRELAEGAAEVEIFGEPVAVRAAVHVLDGFSAHADHDELLDWLGTVVEGRKEGDSPLRGQSPGKPRVVLTHGEDEERAALAEAVRERFGIEAERPGAGAVLEF